MTRPNPPRLVTSFAWTLAGNASFAGAQWLVVIALARVGSAHMVGTYTLGLAIAAPVYLLFNLQLRAVQATDALDQYTFEDYAGLRSLCVVGAAITTAAIVAAGGYGSVAAALLLVSLSKAVEAFSDLAYGELQRNERMRGIGISLCLRGVGGAAALTLTVAMTGSLTAGLWGLVAVWCTVLALHDLPAAARTARIRVAFDRLRLRKMLALSLPLGVVMMLISLTYNVPRYFVEHALGREELGYFAAVSYLAVAGTTFVNSLGEAATPRLARLHAAREIGPFTRFLTRLACAGAALGAVSLAISLVAGRAVLELLYGEPYGAYARVFAITMGAAALSYVASFLGFGITAARSFRIQPMLFAVVAGVTATGCAILVPRHGLPGAAWALVAGSATHLGGSIAIGTRVVRDLGRSAVPR